MTITADPAPQADAPSAGLECLSPRGVLDAATDAVRVRRLAEVAELELAAWWAGMHGEPHNDTDPMVTPGGDGTPAVREYALPELAMARSTHTATTRALIADVLDLQHRLPKTWRVVQTGGCEPWVARKVAVTSRTLPADKVGIVDAAVAAAIAGYTPGPVLSLARAKTIAADPDPDAYAARREHEAHRRYVHLARSDEYGYRCVIARITAGDATWIDAMIQRVADILRLTHGHDHTTDELRSLAFGWLARPADLLQLLINHTNPADPAETDQPDGNGQHEDTDDDGEGHPYRYRRSRQTLDPDHADPDNDDAAGDCAEHHPHRFDDGLTADGYWPGEHGADAGPAGPGPDTYGPPRPSPADHAHDATYAADIAAGVDPDGQHPEPPAEPPPDEAQPPAGAQPEPPVEDAPADTAALLADPAACGKPAWLPDQFHTVAGRLAAMTTRQLAAMRGKGTLFIHLTHTALTTDNDNTGMARTEGGQIAPHRVADLADLLGHADVRVVPVRDLNQPCRADAYEHDETTKDHVWLTTGGETWPYPTGTATRATVDFDHTTPFDPGGLPGQTGTHNSSPLRRTHHRWKTHAGYHCDPTSPGTHEWTTPHGLHLRTDHTGTHRIA